MLHVEHLCKRYRDRLALDHLSFSVCSGEIYGLLGPNGAGKTTTINLICNLLTPDAGQVYLAGCPVSAATKAWLGAVPQQNLLYRSLTCVESLDFFARLYGVPATLRQQRIAEVLAQVKLSDRAQTVVEALSGGMQRRLSLAIALVHRPRLLILDEPTTGLDIEARYDLWQLIRQLKQQGITILLTTHLLEEAERLCDRIGILKAGRLLVEGSLTELQQVVQAQEILTLKTTDEQGAIDRAEALGYVIKRYSSDLSVLLPQPLELREVLQQFEGIPIDSIGREPVRLEHIYLEVTRSDSAIEQPKVNSRTAL